MQMSVLTDPLDLEIPNYRLIRRIGEGAFGQVWLAEEKLTRIYCAVKIIPGAGSKRQGVELSGVQKYRQLSQGHPNLIQLPAPPGMDKGCLFYVMELADNALGTRVAAEADYEPSTLASLLAREQRLSIDTALDYVCSILAGVDHLHHSGLRHRDLKPSNVLFVDGAVKLADVGLASRETESSVGTPGYRTPEGESDDLYAVGIMLYQMITGQPASRFPELPADLDRTHDPKRLKKVVHLFNRACDPDRSNRFDSAGQFLDAVRSSTRVSGDRRRWKSYAVQAGVAAVLISLLGWAVLFRPETLNWSNVEFVREMPLEEWQEFPQNYDAELDSRFRLTEEVSYGKEGNLILTGAFEVGYARRGCVMSLMLAVDNQIVHLIYYGKPGVDGHKNTFEERTFHLKNDVLERFRGRESCSIFVVLQPIADFFDFREQYARDPTRWNRILIGHLQRK